VNLNSSGVYFVSISHWALRVTDLSVLSVTGRCEWPI